MKTLLSREALSAVLLASVLGCAYDPPPDARLDTGEDNRFLVGDPVSIVFTEPIRPESLEVRIWPGNKDAYDMEGEFLPEVKPIMDLCTVDASPCPTVEGGEVTLSVAQDGLSASLDVPEGALGPPARPLVLEVTGRLEDLDGVTLDVSRFFDFQVVEEQAEQVACRGDSPDNEPLGAKEGAFLFFANLPVPSMDIDLPQQFFTDIRVNQVTGEFVIMCTDADPKKGASASTNDPLELVIDHGPEAFIFTVKGCIDTDEDEGLVFESEPFTLDLVITPIHFALRDTVLRGRVTTDPDTGLASWDGTMSVGELFMEVGGTQNTYPKDMTNFQMKEITADQVPEDLPRICAQEDPCDAVGGSCDLLDPWPPASVCTE